MAKAISLFMNQIWGVDPWGGSLYPHKKQFCYSHVHKTLSRIDYFLIDNYLFPAVSNVEYTTIVTSDHAPLVLDLLFALLQKTHPPWRLNCTPLNDDRFRETISKVIDDLLITNNSNLTSPSLFWETLKAVVRGEIISYSARTNKMKKLKWEKLIESISELDRRLLVSPSPKLDKERQNLQMSYNLLSTQEIFLWTLWEGRTSSSTPD